MESLKILESPSFLPKSPSTTIISLTPSSVIVDDNHRHHHHRRPSSLDSNCETKKLLILDDSESKTLGANCLTSSLSTSTSTASTFFRSRLGYLITSILLSIVYLTLTQLLVGLSLEHVTLVIVFTLTYNGPSLSRKFITGFSIFIFYWIIFDYMKAFPNYRLRPVAIGSLYQAEKSLFGLCYQGQRVTHNEFWRLQAHPVLTLTSGFFYILWIPLPLSFAVYLFFKRQTKSFVHFSLNFLWINLIGFVIYYIYPAAPPWYIEENGFWFNPATKPSSGRLADFDALLGLPVFALIYSKSSNIFATMPSLHVSYPSLVLFYGLKLRFHPILIATFTSVTIGISFSAVYTSHHYILDVLAGLTTAVIGFLVFQCCLLKMTLFTKFINKLVKEIR